MYTSSVTGSGCIHPDVTPAPLIRSRPWRYINLLTYSLTYLHVIFLCTFYTITHMFYDPKMHQNVLGAGPMEGRDGGNLNPPSLRKKLKNAYDTGVYNYVVSVQQSPQGFR